jgi:predicted glycosyltransferase
MKLLIGIGHPAHVHFFKNFIHNFQKKGHEVRIIARDKEVTVDLLKKYHLEYELFSGHKRSLMGKLLEIPHNDLIFLRAAKKFNPDLVIGINNYTSAHVGVYSRIPSIIFTDTEEAALGNLLTFPFATTICTPSCFLNDLGKKQVRYNGYHELAYLHPNYFTPDPGVLDQVGILKGENYFLLRFISWAASHDIGLSGMRMDSVTTLIQSLEEHGRVFISSERTLDPALEKYRLNASPEIIHSLMSFASLYMGEGGTMAAEAAILGTPAIHIESNASGIATGNLSGNFRELRDRYGLLYFFADQNEAFSKALEILKNRHAKQEWQKKRENLLKDKVDVTAWMTDFIERYPQSFEEYRGAHV